MYLVHAKPGKIRQIGENSSAEIISEIISEVR
jgi:hypothetical protein